MSASDKGQPAVIKVLLAKGANPAAVNHENKTARAYGEAKNNQDVVALLQSSARSETRGTSQKAATAGVRHQFGGVPYQELRIDTGLAVVAYAGREGLL